MVLFNTEDYLSETNTDLLFIDWQVFREELLDKAGDHNCILRGYEGLWNGRFNAGFCGDLKEAIETATNNKDDFKFEIDEEDGNDLFITTYHHDGHNRYRIRILTDKGEQIWADFQDPDSPYYDLTEQEIHKILISAPNSERIVFE